MEQKSSNLFEGLKSVGHVTGPLPFIVRHGKSPQDTRILTIVNKSFLTFTTNLALTEVSLPHERDIKVITSDERYIYSASGRSILQWGRGSKHLIQRLDNGHQSDVKLMVKSATDKLVSVDEDNVLFNWGLEDKSILNIIHFDEGSFKITALCHPLTYKDKCLLGSEQGQLELWNLPNEKCLYTFRGWESPVTCLVQSPVPDVIAIGLADGHVYVHNIRYDEVVMKIYQDYGQVTSMSFRLDDQPYLVTASEVGHLMVWNLERKRLSTQIRNAHSGSISNCQFVRNESLLITSGNDNSLKVWSMDMSDGGGTLLHHRSGHSEPPSFIRFYGPKGFNLLSAGRDSTIKMFHLYSERLNRNFGIARMNPKSKQGKDKTMFKKLPPITCFAAETSKEKQWDNIAACHEDSNLVTTWNYDKCCMGEHIINQPTFEKHSVFSSCVTISKCGNYFVIGFSNGLIFKYNIQSGLFRQYYESNNLSEHRAHDGKVSSITTDGLDIILISSGYDRMLRLWNFKTSILLSEVEFSSPIIKIELHKENNLTALALDDNSIELFDLETRTIVRKFSGPASILDLTFSPDSQWLIVAYDDKSIRTWNLSLGRMIDAFKLATKCTSLSMSTTGEFLATAHEDSLGINIWCNFTLYCPTPLRPIDTDDEPIDLEMPFVLNDEQIDQSDEQVSEDQTLPEKQTEVAIPDYISPDQLDQELISLSGLPSSRWKNLLNVDEMRQQQLVDEEEQRKRNRPMKVPFFIPVKDGLKPALDAEAVKSLNESSDSRLITTRILDLQLLSPLAQLLVECGHKNDYTEFLTKLKELGPSATDFEIRSLDKETCGSEEPMLCFLNAMQCNLESKLDYELTSSWLAVFLQAYSDTIITDAKIRKRCAELLVPVESNWNNLRDKFTKIFCVLNFIRSSIL